MQLSYVKRHFSCTVLCLKALGLSQHWELWEQQLPAFVRGRRSKHAPKSQELHRGAAFSALLSTHGLEDEDEISAGVPECGISPRRSLQLLGSC